MIESGKCPHCGGSLFRDEDKEIRCQQCGKPPLWKPPPRSEQEIAREKRRGLHHIEGRVARVAASAELEARIAREKSPDPKPEPKSEAISPDNSPEETKLVPVTKSEPVFHSCSGFNARGTKCSNVATYQREGKHYCWMHYQKREVIVKNETPEETEEPQKKRKSRKIRDNFLENNREAIIHDYYDLTLLKFLAKWQISSIKWGKLREFWKVKLKRGVYADNKTTPAVKETAEPAPDPVVDETPFRTEAMNKRTGARAIWKF